MTRLQSPHVLLELTSIIDMAQFMPLEKLLDTLEYMRKMNLIGSQKHNVEDEDLGNISLEIPRYTTDHIYFENSALFGDSLRMMVLELNEAGVLGNQRSNRDLRLKQKEILAKYHGVSGQIGLTSRNKLEPEEIFDKRISDNMWDMLTFLAENSFVEGGKVQLAMFETKLHQRFQDRALGNLFTMLGHETPFTKEAYITLEDIQSADLKTEQRRDYTNLRVRNEDENMLGVYETHYLKQDLKNDEVYPTRWQLAARNKLPRNHPIQSGKGHVTFGEKISHQLMTMDHFNGLAKAKRLTMQDCFDLGILPESEAGLIAKHFGFKLKGGARTVTQEDLKDDWKEIMNNHHMVRNHDHNYFYHLLDAEPEKRADIDQWFGGTIEKIKQNDLSLRDAVVLGIAKPEIAREAFTDTLTRQGFFDYHLTFERAEKLMTIAPRLGQYVDYIHSLTQYKEIAANRGKQFVQQIQRSRNPDKIEHAFSAAMMSGYVSLKEFVLTCEKLGTLIKSEEDDLGRTEYRSKNGKIIISLDNSVRDETKKWKEALILVKAAPKQKQMAGRNTEPIEVRGNQYRLNSALHTLRTIDETIQFNDTIQKPDYRLQELTSKYPAEEYMVSDYEAIRCHMRSADNNYFPAASIQVPNLYKPPSDRRYNIIFDSLVASALLESPLDFMEKFLETVNENTTVSLDSSPMSAGEIKLSQLLYCNFLRYDRKLKTSLRADDNLQKPYENYSSALVRLVKPDRWNLGEISLYEAAQQIVKNDLDTIEIVGKTAVAQHEKRVPSTFIFNTDKELTSAIDEGELQDYITRNLADYKTQLRGIEKDADKLKKQRKSLQADLGIKITPMQEIGSSIFRKIKPNPMLDMLCAVKYHQTETRERDRMVRRYGSVTEHITKVAQDSARQEISPIYYQYAQQIVHNAARIITEKQSKYGGLRPTLAKVTDDLKELGIADAKTLITEEKVRSALSEGGEALQQYLDKQLSTPIIQTKVAQAQRSAAELTRKIISRPEEKHTIVSDMFKGSAPKDKSIRLG